MFDRTSLAYPCSGAGFDPTHLAARSCQFSAIASGGNFVNVLTGRIGTIVNGTGAPVFACKGRIGPAVNLPTTAGTGYITMAGDAATPIAVTMGAIVQMNVSQQATAQTIFNSSDTVATGCQIRASLTTGALAAVAGALVTSGIVLTAGIPYFVAASIVANIFNFVVCRLDTGQVFTATSATAPTFSAPDGTFVIGNGASHAAETNACIAAVMFARNFLTLPQLVAWAGDPWAFWYPRRTFYQIAPSAAAGFPWWAVRNNKFVIGTGVQ